MRLIDADALDLDREVEMADDWNTAHEMANLIKYAPTIEARPLVHGEWIKHEYAEESEGLLIPNFECSVCHGWKREETPFCPECGADMRTK